jgi:predicted DNA-binding transcriptional regulator AlpA
MPYLANLDTTTVVNPYPANRLLRLPAVLDRLPISRSSLLEGVKNGIYPKPVKLGARCVAWRESDINALVNSLGVA